MTDVIVPRRGETLIDKNGEPTLRFIKFIESLTTSNNDNTSGSAANLLLIQELANNPSLLSQMQFLQQQIDGLPEFTIDTTGFTFDSTLITFDKVIA